MYSQAVIGTHLFVPRSEVRDLEDIKVSTTAYSKFNQEPVPMYNDRNYGWFGFPLYYHRQHRAVSENIRDLRTVGKPIQMSFRSSYRPGQDELINEFVRRLGSGGTGFILNAPPGFGKTVMVISMLSMLKRTALIVVPRSNLVRQWVDRILQHSSIRAEEVGVGTGGKVEWEGKKIVVALVHTLALDRFGVAFKKNFGVTVFDEVDRSVPPQTFAPVVGMFPAKYRIGVSATMKRQDGMEVVFQNHVGEHFLKSMDIGRMRPKVLVHYYDIHSGPIFGNDTLRMRGQLISRLAGNHHRNRMIARYVRSITVTGRRCLVLSDRIQQLLDIEEILLENKWAKAEETGMYVRRLPVSQLFRTRKKRYRELKEAERREVAKKSQIILATYGMFALGTDIKDLAGLVYATPMSEITQSKGRIERELAGKMQPVVVDIVDSAYDMAVRWGYKRVREYGKDGLLIKKVR
jgi:superfamily II DNA or RNA helicase